MGRRSRRGSPRDALDNWIDAQPESDVDQLDVLCKSLIGQRKEEVLRVLTSADVTAPREVLEILAARLSSVPSWAYASNGTAVPNEKTGRLSGRISNRADLIVRATARNI